MLKSSAVEVQWGSIEGKYRYQLERQFSRGPTLAWVTLNPSEADASTDDATIKKVCRFSLLWGYGGIDVYSLFAFRSDEPFYLFRCEDPVGPLNDHWLSKIVCRPVVCAWGALHPRWREREKSVCRMLAENECEFMCIGWTKDRWPMHPSRAAYTERPIKWLDRDFARVEGRKECEMS